MRVRNTTYSSTRRVLHIAERVGYRSRQLDARKPRRLSARKLHARQLSLRKEPCSYHEQHQKLSQRSHGA